MVCAATFVDEPIYSNLEAMVKAEELFPSSDDPDGRVRDVKAWLKLKGVRDFEAVSLFCDQLGKVSLHLPS